MIPYSTFTLNNGLRVVHSYDPESAMVVLNTLYDTGARDEAPTLTGIAHLFEHLMFGGSVNVPSFDRQMELAGGHNNAATGNDFTIFYEIMPAQNAEMAFYLESDRMLQLAFSQRGLEVQQHVVVEEFKEVFLNRPYGRLMHHLRPMLYKDHPYRWPVIGIKPEHVEKVTLEDVRKWFYSHYAPNNAILAVVGNITLERTRELCEKWYGSIPARQVEARKLTDDPWPTLLEREVVYDNVPQPMIAIGFRMDEYGTKGFFAADAITDILAAGQSSRFFQRLVMGTDLFTSAEASITGAVHSGMLILTALISRDDDESIEQAQDMLLAQVKQLAEEGNVSEYELERTKNRYESTFTFDNVALLNRAHNLAQALYHGEDINENVPRYRSLTLEEIASTARSLFIDHAPAIVILRPTPEADDRDLKK